MNKLDKKKLKKIAIQRAEQILQSWWREDLGEFQQQENLTDQELDYVVALRLKLEVKLCP